MTLADLIENIDIQGSMVISVWDGDKKVERNLICDYTNFITIADVESAGKDFSKMPIKYISSIVIELDKTDWNILEL